MRHHEPARKNSAEQARMESAVVEVKARHPGSQRGAPGIRLPHASHVVYKHPLVAGYSVV